MDLDDERWATLLGGYRLLYDPRPALRELEHGDTKSAWNELWNELHHQGAVGEASYAALPRLVAIHERRGVPDWNTYALAATIEECRQDGSNPAVPEWVRNVYAEAWRRLVLLALQDLAGADDENLVCSAIAVVAMGKQQRTLSRMALLTEDERKEMLGEAG